MEKSKEPGFFVRLLMGNKLYMALFVGGSLYYFASAPGIFSLLICLGSAGVLIYRHLTAARSGKTPPLPLTDEMAVYAGYSEKELIMGLIRRELAALEAMQIKPVAKKLVPRRLLYSFVFALLLLFVLLGTYTAPICVPLTLLLLMGYARLMGGSSDEKLLYKAAKESPDRPISQVVAEETDDDNLKQKRGKSVWLCAALFVVAVGLFLFGGWETHYTVEPAEKGYRLVDYRPGLSQFFSMTVPAIVEGQPITEIGADAFSSLGYLQRIDLPDSVTAIRSGAFRECSSLQEITLPAGLLKLEGETFKDCASLTAIVVPAGVTEIRGNTFEGCSSLETVTLHDGILDIHAYAFQNCSSLTEITLPPHITEIHTYTFDGCSSLKAIAIPDRVTRIAAHAFSGCGDLAEVTLPDSLLEIRSSAFRECSSLEEIYVPVGVSIDERAFKDSPTDVKTKE